MAMIVEYCGEQHRVPPDGWLTLGREGDVALDDNPYLHRQFLQVGSADGLSWIINNGHQLAATVSDSEARVQAWLAPGARLPLVFEHTIVRFTAGRTTYEVDVHISEPVFSDPMGLPDSTGDTTIGLVTFTRDQRLLIVALAEPMLRAGGRGTNATLPSSAEAADRLGWTIRRFNRKLDNVCEKLAKVGVQGLHGGPGDLASNRRARLVEYALSVRLISADDLVLLDEPHPET